VLAVPLQQGNSGSDRKVLRLRVMDDDGGGGFLGVELVFFGEGDADFFGAQQRQSCCWSARLGQAG
jgi:hypothetical protein